MSTPLPFRPPPAMPRAAQSAARRAPPRTRLPRLAAGLLAAAVLLAPVALAAFPPQRVDLERPQALARVQRERPAHYRAIVQILREAPSRSPESIRGWIRTAFDGATGGSVYLLKASDPPKARLSFRLDDTQYVTVVTLTGMRPEIR